MAFSLIRQWHATLVWKSRSRIDEAYSEAREISGMIMDRAKERDAPGKVI
jgi:hypothetical protein